MNRKYFTYQQIKSHVTLLAPGDGPTDHFRHTMIVGHTVLEPPVKVIDLKVTAVETAELTKFWEDVFHQHGTLYSSVWFGKKRNKKIISENSNLN